jgi:hypothetical protein
MPLRLVPSPLTAAMIAIEIPAAINPYSMAVAAVSFRQKRKTNAFITLPFISARRIAVSKVTFQEVRSCKSKAEKSPEY